MGKWEYRREIVRTMNYRDVDTILSQFDYEGWDLVSTFCTPDGGNSYIHLIFRRERNGTEIKK